MQTNLSPRAIIFFAVFSVTFLSVLHAYGQKLIRSYVDTATKAISSIEPDSSNYADLEIIGKAVGEKRVVMLGEQDHGDAPTFLAKTRLIKYLHQKKGFTVLAFESDFYSLNDGWERLDKNRPAINDFILRNIFGIWTLCSTCETLFYKYIPATYQTQMPLIVTGFDSQQYLNYSFYHLNHNLDSVLRLHNLEITKHSNYATEILPLIDSSKKWGFVKPVNVSRVNECLDDLELIRSQLKAVINGDDFWLLVVDNLIQQATATKFEMETGKPDVEKRDAQMALNLQWLIEHKFKNQKIIVWAASSHIARSLKNVDDRVLNKHQPMGEQLIERMHNPNEVYVLGFTSYKGTGGRIGGRTYKVSTRNPNSYEGWLNAGGFNYAFTDFGKFNAQYPTANEDFIMAPLGHYSTTGKWNKVFDGIFFIRDTYQCKALDHQPN